MSTANMSDKIIKAIQSMAGRYGVYEIFGDWVKMIALAFANQIEYDDKREKDYLDVVHRYDPSELNKLMEMTAWLVEWADEEMTDMLGYVYMHLELGSKAHVQFFTPYNICRMMGALQKFDGNIVKINEPACGAGGNIIALAEAMRDQGFNYQTKMDVVCQDIDVKAVYMTYIQMTLYGIPAVCFQSNTLSDPQGKESSTGRLKTYGYVLNMWRLKNDTQAHS